jgi:hypothetical protein
MAGEVNTSVMVATKAMVFTVLLLSAAFIVQTDFGRPEFYLGATAPSRMALIINTWNDFEDHSLIDVDSFPSQSIQAYKALMAAGYTNDEITLMIYHTGDDFVDGDGDGVNDLDGVTIDYENSEVTRENLERELTRMAFLSDESTEVMIYVVAHGGFSGYENAFSFEDGSKVSSNEFFDLLAPIKSENVFLFLDFCYSGSFVGEHRPFQGVYLWAASGNNLDLFYWNYKYMPEGLRAVFGESGSVFFHPFWKAIQEGGGVMDAFQYGRSQLLKWQRVDPIVYREGADLPLKQSPDIRIEKGWVSDINGFATSLAYTGMALMALMLGTYTFAIGATLYRWHKLAKMRTYWWADSSYTIQAIGFGEEGKPSEG